MLIVKTSKLLLFLMLFCAGSLLLVSCQSNQSDQSAAETQIPELLDRNAKIQMGKEWDYVQNYYVEQREAIRNNPSDFEAYLNLAQLFVKEARVTGEHGHYYPGALQLTAKILEESPEDEDVVFRTLTTKAGVELSQHEFEQALETGLKALQLNNQNAQIHGVLVDAYVELGDYERAVAMADRMIMIKPDLRSYSRVSYLREIHGDVDGAIEAMKLAVSAGFPGYEETAWSKLTLADLYKTYDMTEEAENTYAGILKDRPDYPFAIAALASLKLDEGDYQTAETKLIEAINIIPEVGFYIDLARIYKAQNRTEEFEEITKEIFAMLQDDVDSGHNMNLEYASFYFEVLDNPDKALEYTKIEYEKRPKNIDVNKMLASIYLEKEAKEQASKHIVAASITSSKHPELEELKQKL